MPYQFNNIVGELISGGEARVRAKGKFLSMSRESTAEVVPYLKFNLCRKYRTLFQGIKEAK
ncbi:MAG: hypothetical protein A2X96_12040 [Syntrophobacterales bacterium GWC2_56_13]|nr:MAG: hypothetical protein A2X96_12040 [Syntrophobacterales bacterium GWC2_56_13]OHE19920.1 MAG: hypothetical protein A2X95_07455 [Syntrophobacterales bacterium GWF2_56_9]